MAAPGPAAGEQKIDAETFAEEFAATLDSASVWLKDPVAGFVPGEVVNYEKLKNVAEQIDKEEIKMSQLSRRFQR